jgi:hypothetical protein
MANQNSFNSFFLSRLYDNKVINHNPFLLCLNPEYKSTYNNFSPFGFFEDLLEKEVRCPICLGRVSKASAPDSCNHTFCFLCLEKWSKSSNKCPICRRFFTKIKAVDIRDPKISDQMNLFI